MRTRYIVGWHFVPGYIRSCLKHFVPVSAVDVAWMKAGHGRGSMYLEACVDSDHRIHPIGISDRLTTENLDGYIDFSRRNIAATTSGLLSPLQWDGRVVLGDGNVAIPASMGTTRPSVAFVRDWRHHSQDIPRRLRPLFTKLKFMPRSRRGEVDAALTALRSQDPASHELLTRVPLAQWCLSHVPASTHGHTTSNMVEILACMLLGARRHASFLGSLLWAISWCNRRWKDMWDTASRLHRELRPTRQEASFQRALRRAKEIHCAVTGDTLTSLNQSIIVACDRGAPEVLASVERRSFQNALTTAWELVADGNEGSIRQSHVVSLQALATGQFDAVCSCGGVAHEWVLCSHAAFALNHHHLATTKILNKPWLYTWQEHLGRISDTAVLCFFHSREVEIDVSNVTARVVQMAEGKRLLRVTQPALAVRETKKTQLRGDSARYRAPAEAPLLAALAHRAAGGSVRGRKLPGHRPVPPAFNRHLPQQPTPTHPGDRLMAVDEIGAAAMEVDDRGDRCDACDEGVGGVAAPPQQPTSPHPTPISAAVTPTAGAHLIKPTLVVVPTPVSSATAPPSESTGVVPAPVSSVAAPPPESMGIVPTPGSSVTASPPEPGEAVPTASVLTTAEVPTAPVLTTAGNPGAIRMLMVQNCDRSPHGQHGVVYCERCELYSAFCCFCSERVAPFIESCRCLAPAASAHERVHDEVAGLPSQAAMRALPKAMPLAGESPPSTREQPAGVSPPSTREQPAGVVCCTLQYSFRVESARGKQAVSSLEVRVPVEWSAMLHDALRAMLADLADFSVCSSACLYMHEMHKNNLGDFVSCFLVHGRPLSCLYVDMTLAASMQLVMDHEDFTLASSTGDHLRFEFSFDGLVGLGGPSAMKSITGKLPVTSSSSTSTTTTTPSSQDKPLSFGDIMSNLDIQAIILQKLNIMSKSVTLPHFTSSGLVQKLELIYTLAAVCKAALGCVLAYVESVQNLHRLQNSGPAPTLRPAYAITQADRDLIEAAVRQWRVDPRLVFNQAATERNDGTMPLTWNGFKTTLGSGWLRMDAMDLMLQQLQPFLPKGVRVLLSTFGGCLLHRSNEELSRQFRRLRSEGARISRFAWPYVKDGHWVAFYVDLHPNNVNQGHGRGHVPPTNDTGTPAPPIFHAMDSLDIRVDGALRTEFQHIFERLVRFLEFEAQRHGDTVFGAVPSAGEWTTRQMSIGVHPPLTTPHCPTRNRVHVSCTRLEPRNTGDDAVRQQDSYNCGVLAFRWIEQRVCNSVITYTTLDVTYLRVLLQVELLRGKPMRLIDPSDAELELALMGESYSALRRVQVNVLRELADDTSTPQWQLAALHDSPSKQGNTHVCNPTRTMCARPTFTSKA